ncbi:hypothetical protein SISNIDRAFT_459431 [Sistotremastrum niveocremeum HHB9708]|uniref:Transmembrane protein n=1 Tax=Sistotremastrum niveocremeum HHB9708 TaxID=1314777 RepID=A0A164PK71_9AGAM|nr:hypothetical protein SISNIDRAFT_459431 [Sistotremastrum niveocremeum HHB9708]
MSSSFLLGSLVLGSLVSLSWAADDCFYNEFGQLQCRRVLPFGWRIGIAIGSAVIICIIAGLFSWRRSRRNQANNVEFVQPPSWVIPQQPQMGMVGAPTISGGVPPLSAGVGPRRPDPAFGGFAPGPAAPNQMTSV